MKTRTIKQFVKDEGSEALAAAAIGVDESTVSRWLNKETKPRGALVKRRLAELGVRA